MNERMVAWNTFKVKPSYVLQYGYPKCRKCGETVKVGETVVSHNRSSLPTVHYCVRCHRKIEIEKIERPKFPCEGLAWWQPKELIMTLISEEELRRKK